jgi:hypothetical protein
MTQIPSGTKFIGIKSTYPTSEKKSALANSYSEIYTIEDIKKGAVQLGLNFDSVGPKVSFKRPDFSPNTTDIVIPGLVEFKRDNNGGGIYNAQEEVSWNSNQSPLYTQWNSVYTDNVNNGWGNLFNASNRTFDTFRDSLNGIIGAIIIGQKLLFRHIYSGRTWIIEFTEWTQGGNGGGFAYDRYELFPATDFYRPSDSPSTVDNISEGLIIKRDNVRGIYNAVLETSYNNDWDISPKGTEWNSSYTDPNNYGFADLSNLRTRKYSTWREAVDANPPASVSDELELIMHDLSTDLYWKIVFTAWGIGDDNDEGVVGYTRTLVPQDYGIKFNDGTVMTTSSMPTDAGTAGSSGSPITLGDNVTLYGNIGSVWLDTIDLPAGSGADFLIFNDLVTLTGLNKVVMSVDYNSSTGAPIAWSTVPNDGQIYVNLFNAHPTLALDSVLRLDFQVLPI